MPVLQLNGTDLYYESTGSGEIPLAFVHGGWVSHAAWDAVVLRLDGTVRTLTYDRRGHSQSGPVTPQSSLHHDVADLAQLLERLEFAPAWIVANSSGCLPALRLAAERPALVQGLILHEPPLWGLLADDPAFAPMLEALGTSLQQTVTLIAAGKRRRAAEFFVANVIGPDAWRELPPSLQETLVENARTILVASEDVEFASALGLPAAPRFNASFLGRIACPVLLTQGARTSPAFSPVIDRLTRLLQDASVEILPAAGHVPQWTHPDELAQVIARFIAAQQPPLAAVAGALRVGL